MIRTALFAMLVLTASKPLLAAGPDRLPTDEPSRPHAEPGAQSVRRIADDTWQWVLANDNTLRDAAEPRGQQIAIERRRSVPMQQGVEP